MKKIILILCTVFSASISVAGQFQPGETFINADGIYGKVLGFYSDGQIAAQLETSSISQKISAHYLAKTYGKIGQFAVGQTVINMDGINGVINGIYPDGKLAVTLETTVAPQIFSSEQLSKVSEQ